jgi:uroporphyrinogen decarboxylase
MLHNFMLAAREAGVTMQHFRTDPNAIARSFTDAIERYEYDGVIIDIDTVTLAGAAGVPIDFPADAPARVTGGRIRTLEEVRDLPPIDVLSYQGVQVWLEAVRLLKRNFGDEVYIRGNCDQCPFSLASLIRTLDGWMMDLVDPEKESLVHALLDFCTGITSQFIQQMSSAGAHMISNGDSIAGPELISPSMFRQFALPYERQVVETSHKLGFPYILHICGNTASILDDMIATGADGLEIDYRTDARLAHQKMKESTVFIGNLDPSGVLARGSEELVEQETLNLLSVFADTPRFILNAGCAIPPITPSKNIRAMIRVARSFAR